MSKAQHDTTHLSRRAALAGLLALPAAAGAAHAPSGDAELLALEPAFTPLFAAWVKHKAVEHDEHFRLEVTLERSTGTKLVDVPDFTDSSQEADAARKAYYALRQKHFTKTYEEFGPRYDPAFDLDDLDDRLRELTADILAQDATTAEGLAMQARAMFFENSDALDMQTEWGSFPEHPSLRSFLRSVFAFSGMPFPPYRSYGELLIEREA